MERGWRFLGFHEVLLHLAPTVPASSVDWIGLSQRIESVRFLGFLKACHGRWPAPGRMGEPLQIWDVASGELDLSIPVSYDTGMRR